MHRTPGRTSKRGLRRLIVPTPRDITIFQLLQRYRYLPANFIWSLLPNEVRGRSDKRFIERLGDLFHEGYLNRPRRQWFALNARYKPCVYELDAKAKRELALRGLLLQSFRGPCKHFSHELLVCTIQASLEITCMEATDLTYVPWSEILSYKSLPETTRRAEHPFRIPVTVEGRSRTYAPDGKPAGIRYKSPSRGSVALCFPGFEADCATEPLDPVHRYERQSIRYKFQAYLDIARRRTYTTHFGFPNMIVPFVTTAEARMRNMMALLEKLTDGNGTSFIVFNCNCSCTSIHVAIFICYF